MLARGVRRIGALLHFENPMAPDRRTVCGIMAGYGEADRPAVEPTPSYAPCRSGAMRHSAREYVDAPRPIPTKGSRQMAGKIRRVAMDLALAVPQHN